MSEKLFAFIVMPFAKNTRPRYDAIKSAAEKAGMRAERADDQSFFRAGIVNRIHRQIEEADFVIADMTAPPNPNVYYEVGYAHAKKKLCIFLTKDPDAIPFDLRHLPHIVYRPPRWAARWRRWGDLTAKLLDALETVKRDTEVSFYLSDPNCFAKVPVVIFEHRPISQSETRSIRVRVRASRELQPTNVTGHIMKIEERTVDGEWSEIQLADYVQLTWAGTDTIAVNFDDAAAKYLNVLHIDRADNKKKVARNSVSTSGVL